MSDRSILDLLPREARIDCEFEHPSALLCEILKVIPGCRLRAIGKHRLCPECPDLLKGALRRFHYLGVHGNIVELITGENVNIVLGFLHRKMYLDGQRTHLSEMRIEQITEDKASVEVPIHDIIVPESNVRSIDRIDRIVKMSNVHTGNRGRHGRNIG